MNTQILPADKTAEILLQDEQGVLVRLSSLWSEKPAALVFVRHFG